MKVVDANVLLYAMNTDSADYAASRQWLDRSLVGADVIGFTWSSITAFVRIGTKAGLFPSALTVTESCEQVREWLGMPGARLVGPTPQHLDVLSRLLEVAGSGGNLVPDAHLAAIAIEHRADVVSYDSDFARFPGLRVWRPDELLRP